MKAIVLAAGRGERMQPLTDITPKPLLAVQGQPLIAWHLQALARGGVHDVVVNTAWLEEKIVAALGDGAQFGLSIAYSREGRDHGGALETAGGLKKALPLLEDAGTDCFWYVAGDVFAPDFVFAPDAAARFAADTDFGHLWMVPNPPQHPGGDFGMAGDRLTVGEAGERVTWSGIALFRRSFVTELMAELPAGTKAKLRPFLDAAIAKARLGATLYRGRWTDVGTPQRLDELNAGTG